MNERRIVLLAAGALAVSVAALAQTNVDQPATQVTADEWEPASVATPTSDPEARDAGRPLTPPDPTEGPRTQPGETMQPETISPSEEALAADQQVLPPEPARKRWRFTPIFSVGVLYDDNIFLSNEDRVADVIWTISAGLAFELGDFRGESENYLIAQWVGIPTWYTKNSDQSRFDQSAYLLAQYRWSKLLGQFESRFSVTTGGNREVNAITTTNSFSNALRFTYDYSGKTTLDAQFLQTTDIVDSFENTTAYETKLGATYQLFPKTSFGLELVGGITDQSSSPLQYYQQARGRVNYVAREKLTFKLSAGVEVREFEGENFTRFSPVFSLGLEYRPFDSTSISLMGYRNVFASSAVAGQDLIATGFDIRVQQRFFGKMFAAVSFGYENDVYFSTFEQTADTDRVDNYLYVRSTLGYSFVRYISANLFYEYRKNVSNQDRSSFDGNRVGMEIAADF